MKRAFCLVKRFYVWSLVVMDKVIRSWFAGDVRMSVQSRVVDVRMVTECRDEIERARNHWQGAASHRSGAVE